MPFPTWLRQNEPPLPGEGIIDSETQLTPLSGEDIDILRKDLKDIASDELCNKFITEVLKILKATGRAGYETTDIFQLFEAVFTGTRNSFYWDNIRNWGYTDIYIGRNHRGEIDSRRVRIRFNPGHFGVTQGRFGSNERAHSEIYSSMGTVIHELIHAYGFTEMFNHQQMAEVAQSVAIKLVGESSVARRIWREVKVPPDGEDYPNPLELDDALSAYFGNNLSNACNRSSRIYNGKGE